MLDYNGIYWSWVIFCKSKVNVMCGFVINILKYEKEGKKKEKKKETNFSHCKIQDTKLPFLSLIGWL